MPLKIITQQKNLFITLSIKIKQKQWSCIYIKSHDLPD